MPDSVKTISDYAFVECDRLTSITVSDSVIYIGYYEFDYCYVTSVIFENPNGWSVTYDFSKPLSAAELADEATAATYLSSTYRYYTWIREEAVD